MTNWDPALTQQVLTAEIAKNPKIDVIVSDFGPSLVGALPVFKKFNRSIPALATSDGNILGCFWTDNQAKTIRTSSCSRSRPATTTRVWPCNGRWPRRPAGRPEGGVFKAPDFEDSVSGKPSAVQCRKDLPGDIYLSAEMKGDDAGQGDQQVVACRGPGGASDPGPRYSKATEVVVQCG